jgi:hypothetical protein
LLSLTIPAVYFVCACTEDGLGLEDLRDIQGVGWVKLKLETTTQLQREGIYTPSI